MFAVLFGVIGISFLIMTYRKLELRGVCKKLNRWKIYVNTSNCGFCLKQIEFLGGNAHFMNVVHCDDQKNVRECSNIQGMPLWVKGNKSLPGARLSMASLKQLS